MADTRWPSQAPIIVQVAHGNEAAVVHNGDRFGHVHERSGVLMAIELHLAHGAARSTDPF